MRRSKPLPERKLRAVLTPAAFHTPVRGIPRGSALSPRLAAFHLTETDRDFEGHRQVTYVRYMDDFLLFARTRWHLRKAVSRLNRHLSASGFEQHPDKTFIGRVEKGFDWMGFWFTEKGCTSVAPRALNNFLTKLCRLYERTRHQPVGERAERVAKYVRNWLFWLRGICRASAEALLCGPQRPGYTGVHCKYKPGTTTVVWPSRRQ